MNNVNISEIQHVNESQDLFDLDKGDFDDEDNYNALQDPREEEENHQVYQMYEELCNLVQQEYRPDEDQVSAIDEATASEAAFDGSAIIQTRDTPIQNSCADSDDSDDEIERNPKASPIIKDDGKKPKRNKWADKKKYTPRLTEVQEETEPESSFKETDKNKKQGKHMNVKRLQSDIATVVE
jgi:hypothetical protein